MRLIGIMKNINLKTAIRFIFFIAILNGCKTEDIKPKTSTTNEPEAVPMFIGVHQGNNSLIVGYTNSNSTFTKTDEVEGNFDLGTSSDRYVGIIDENSKEFVFTYKNPIDRNLYLGFVNAITGKYLRSLNLNLEQTAYINLFYDNKSNKLFFSMGRSIYEINSKDNSIIHLRTIDNNLEIPSHIDEFSISNYIEISEEKLNYIDDVNLVEYNRKTKELRKIYIDYLFKSIFYIDRSSVNENTFYLSGYDHQHVQKSIVLNTNENTLEEIDLPKIDNHCIPTTWQGQYYNNDNIYITLPYDRGLFPYFIKYTKNSNKIEQFNTPSIVGRSIINLDVKITKF